ncbi:metallophosphoesterase [Ammoniphilus sp. YIM 78166]|uniref:metallophosphoesterase family protein n=1 Tax=Ammoniphilus sp. YIM 78166 TaxID=1644106 RepID=UPI00106FCBCE|nr:metallophosphoesterase family protein [Ammoniphilus sp. YIM 78166]
MKLAFISDIHGNAVALEAVLRDIEIRQIDKIYVLGDLCYRGPEPKRALQLVQSLQTEVIKGNADEWVVRGVRAGEVPEPVLEMMNREREWTLSHLDADDIQYLNNLPMEIQGEYEGISFFGFHATPVSLFDIVPPDASEEVLKTTFMSGTNAEVYLYAHIHRPYVRYIGGKVVLNIGSVGLPFDGLPKASYAIVELGRDSFTTTIQRVNYDIERVVQQYTESDYPNAEKMINVVRSGRF